MPDSSRGWQHEATTLDVIEMGAMLEGDACWAMSLGSIRAKV